jgi:hypothetical protein
MMAETFTGEPHRSFDRQARLTAAHLSDLIGDDGMFVYRYRRRPDRRLPGYNILRHCGAIWSLQKAIEAGIAAPQAGPRVARAMEYLCANHLAPTRTGSACISEGEFIKLGACGLALLVLARAKSDRPHGRKEMMRRLIGYVREQERGDGDFVHKRARSTGDELPFRSDYYTGEALLGLLAAAVDLNDHDTINYGLNVVEGLALRRVGVGAQSHWMMYAADAAHALRPGRTVATYMDEIGASILTDDAYRTRRYCTPVACRTEALLLLRRMRTVDPSLSKCEPHMITAAIAQNLELQMTCARESGAFTRYAASDEVRIDFIQHNLMCLIGLQR